MTLYVIQSRAADGAPPTKPRLLVYSGLTLNDGSADWVYSVTGKALEPLKKDPELNRFAFGAPVELDLVANVQESDLKITLGIVDGNGQRFRASSSGKEAVRPRMKLIDPDGKIMLDKDLSYG